MRLVTKDAAETEALARRLSCAVRSGVVCLAGALGSGKTTFVRGFLRGLGHRGAVPSPTFALVNEYPRLKPRIYHMDLYRLEAAGDLSGMGLEDYLGDEQAVSFIEWPEAAQGRLPEDRLEVFIEHLKNGRRLSFRATGRKAKRWLGALSRAGAP